jgi:hypothetical protein
VHPAGNRTGDLSLMRRGWYHKTIASALLTVVLKGRKRNQREHINRERKTKRDRKREWERVRERERERDKKKR